MTMGLYCNDKHLAANREPRVTKTLVTVALAALFLGACGGGGGSKASSTGDRYAKAADIQSECCQHLQGGARDQCLAGVVKVDDTGTAANSVNQATYACVIEHFVCDPASGHPTQPSAQAQLECIQDLESQ